MDRGDQRGGSRELGRLIDDGYGPAIRYDLQRVGLDLADVWRGRLAPSRVLELVEQGPDDSALAAALRGGPEHRAWTLNTHLLASVLDGVHHTAYVTAQASSKKKLPKPKPLPRPQGATTPAGQPRRLDLSKHPAARPLPEKYRQQMQLTKGG